MIIRHWLAGAAALTLMTAGAHASDSRYAGTWRAVWSDNGTVGTMVVSNAREGKADVVYTYPTGQVSGKAMITGQGLMFRAMTLTLKGDRDGSLTVDDRRNPQRFAPVMKIAD